MAEETYEVEKILKKKVFNGKTLYLVKWSQFGIEDATWESVKVLSNVKDKIKQFQRRNEDLEEGNQCKLEEEEQLLVRDSFKKQKGRPKKLVLSENISNRAQNSGLKNMSTADQNSSSSKIKSKRGRPFGSVSMKKGESRQEYQKRKKRYVSGEVVIRYNSQERVSDEWNQSEDLASSASLFEETGESDDEFRQRKKKKLKVAKVSRKGNLLQNHASQYIHDFNKNSQFFEEEFEANKPDGMGQEQIKNEELSFLSNLKQEELRLTNEKSDKCDSLKESRLIKQQSVDPEKVKKSTPLMKITKIYLLQSTDSGNLYLVEYLNAAEEKPKNLMRKASFKDLLRLIQCGSQQSSIGECIESQLQKQILMHNIEVFARFADSEIKRLQKLH